MKLILKKNLVININVIFFLIILIKLLKIFSLLFPTQGLHLVKKNLCLPVQVSIFLLLC